MKEKNEIATISFNIEEEELNKIADSGRLVEFVETVTKRFEKELKASLVTGIAKWAAAFFNGDENEFWSPHPKGPKGPVFHMSNELDTMAQKVIKLEREVNIRFNKQ